MRIRLFLAAYFCFACLAALAAAAAPPGEVGWERVAEILGKKGDLSADGVYKVTFPRTEVKVTMNGEPVPVGMGLASWAAFTKMSDGKTMVMGDTVMLGSEVNHVIDALRAGGIEVVALHNHMIGEQPQILFLHYQGMGEAETLAKTVRGALDWLGLKVEVTTEEKK